MVAASAQSRKRCDEIISVEKDQPAELRLCFPFVIAVRCSCSVTTVAMRTAIPTVMRHKVVGVIRYGTVLNQRETIGSERLCSPIGKRKNKYQNSCGEEGAKREKKENQNSEPFFVPRVVGGFREKLGRGRRNGKTR